MSRATATLPRSLHRSNHMMLFQYRLQHNNVHGIGRELLLCVIHL